MTGRYITGRYIYANKVGAGPEHPKKRWGLFSQELTEEQARARYELNPVHGGEWLGVVLLEPGQERPRAYLQVSPRANGIALEKLNAHGSVEAAYSWGAYYTPSDDRPYEGDEDRLFLSQIIWYAYPEEERFFGQSESVGNVIMHFGPDGYVSEEVVRRHGFGVPSDVEVRESRGVDVSANWFRVPEFGDWDAFFHPDPEE